MPFAIGTVQDAGLIFLSSMANTIANQMLDDGESEEAILSTTLVLLSLGTALLGVVLIVIGKCKLANAVSYLPMPVVGGYLAFIGYFCVQAGVALCISHPLVAFADWTLVFTPRHLLLAVPGLFVGIILTYVARKAKNEAILPLTMIGIPALFYILIFVAGTGLDGARQGGWVGEVSDPVPFTDLLQLVDFSLVRWGLVDSIGWTWVGMVFVVAFASCLDVAAISMDKGEALDTNQELATVGIGNCKRKENIAFLLDSFIKSISSCFACLCSDVGFDFWFHRQLHFLPDDLHLSDGSSLQSGRVHDNGCFYLYCHLPYQHS